MLQNMTSDLTWLMLVTSLAGQNQTARMRIWRALKASGAGALRDGVYLLPRLDASQAVFDQQAAEVTNAGGSAHVVALASVDAEQERQFRRLFDRSIEYAALHASVDAWFAELDSLQEVDARRRLAGLRRELAALVAIDFFPDAARQHVETVLADAEARLNKIFSPDEPHASGGDIPKRERAAYQGRVWATRARLWVDRVASAWLIRRFIDPKATFRWLESPADCPKKAVGFDFDGGEFTHVGGRVTFEVLLVTFGLDHDRGLMRLAALVHYLDVGGVAVPEAAGLTAILAGARTRVADDDTLLETMSTVFDDLYTTYSGPESTRGPTSSQRGD